MSHHHHHDKEDGEMPFQEKIIRIMEHWIKHNLDHADSFRDWAHRAEHETMTDIARLLEEAAELNLRINSKLEEALKHLR